MGYFLQNRPKMVQNKQKWLRMSMNVPMDPLSSPWCLSTRSECLFGSIWYLLSLSLPECWCGERLLNVLKDVGNNFIWTIPSSNSAIVKEWQQEVFLLVDCVLRIGTLSQMLSWWTKNSLHIINIWDTVTKVLPLCSVFQAPSHESNLTLLAPFATEFPYLSMIFILGMVQTISRITNMLE